MAIYLNGQLVAGGNMVTNNLVFLKDKVPTTEDLNQYNSNTLIVYTGQDEVYFYICWEYNNTKNWYKINMKEQIESVGGV